LLPIMINEHNARTRARPKYDNRRFEAKSNKPLIH
jgi:hypothetical protein